MNYGSFKTQVLNFLKRKDLGSDQLGFFINLAKTNLQRNRNLSLSKGVTTLTYPSVEGKGVALPADFKAPYSEFAAVILNAEGGATPLRGSTFSQEKRRQRDDRTQLTSIETSLIRWVLEARSGAYRLFLVPEVADAEIEFHYYAFLPDYSADTDEDVLLTVGRDALLWETLKVANMFLVEEDRVQIDATLAAGAITALEDWCKQAVTGGVTLDLA